MVLLRWLFHKKLDLGALKREIRELVELFREYILIFDEKKSSLITIQRLSRFEVLRPEIERFNKELLSQLRDQDKEEGLIQLILSSNIVTPGERKTIDSIKGKLYRLKAILSRQLELFRELEALVGEFEKAAEKDPYAIDGIVLPARKRVEAMLDQISSLIYDETKVLFGERTTIDQLKRDILEGLEFPVVTSVECPAVKTAMIAERNLNLFRKSRLELGFFADLPAIVAYGRYKLVHYPGSLDDPLVIFAFPNSEIYILQDPQEPLEYLNEYLDVLNRVNTIQNLKRDRNRFTFTFNNQAKLLVAYYGGEGFSDRFVPPEIQQFGIDVIMTKALSIGIDEIKAILKNINPFIKKGAFVDKQLLGENTIGYVKITRVWYQKQ